MLLPLLLLVHSAGPTLLEQIQSSGTQSYLVLKNGQPVDAFQPTTPVPIQSLTIPFLSLATGLLLKEGKLDSIDKPLGKILPQLQSSPKAGITLKHLLSHSSGIRDPRDAKGQLRTDFLKSADYLAAVIHLPVDSPPGRTYAYNNAGIVLLAAALGEIAGQPVHLYLDRALFKPLGIQSAQWQTDSKGLCPFFTGLTIDAAGLARIGQLILNDGESLLTPEWIAGSTATPSLPSNSRLGLLWFFQPSVQSGKPVFIQHTGDGGNYLLIFPRNHIVAVRLRPNTTQPDSLNNFPGQIIDQFLR